MRIIKELMEIWLNEVYDMNLEQPFLVANTWCQHTMDYFNMPPMPGAVSEICNPTSDNPSTCITFLQNLCQHNTHTTFIGIQMPCSSL